MSLVIAIFFIALAPLSGHGFSRAPRFERPRH
jgi:hypothetical protein